MNTAKNTYRTPYTWRESADGFFVVQTWPMAGREYGETLSSHYDKAEAQAEADRLNRQEDTMKTAILIDPTARTVTIDRRPWTLRDLQEAVGGYIDVYTAIKGLSVFVDDEGLLKGPADFFILPGCQPLAGVGVILGDVDEDGETLGLTDEQADTIHYALAAFVQFATTKGDEDDNNEEAAE